MLKVLGYISRKATMQAFEGNRSLPLYVPGKVDVRKIALPEHA
jgi:hypothetical protein